MRMVAFALAGLLATAGPALARQEPLTVDVILGLESFGRVAIDPSGAVAVFEERRARGDLPRHDLEAEGANRYARLYRIDLDAPDHPRPLLTMDEDAGYSVGAFSPILLDLVSEASQEHCGVGQRRLTARLVGDAADGRRDHRLGDIPANIGLRRGGGAFVGVRMVVHVRPHPVQDEGSGDAKHAEPAGDHQSGPVAGTEHQTAARHQAHHRAIADVERRSVCAEQGEGHAQDEEGRDQAGADGDHDIEHRPGFRRRARARAAAALVAPFAPADAAAADREALAGHEVRAVQDRRARPRAAPA